MQRPWGGAEMEDQKEAQRRHGKSCARRTLRVMVGAWLFSEGRKDKRGKAISLDFSFSKTPSLLPGGEGVGGWGSRAEAGSSPSTAPTTQTGTG